MGQGRLKGKNILITAGPTWVPIDNVRVISNTATGETGILLANYARKLGAKVTLLLGPVAYDSLNKNIKFKHFVFFDELKSKVIKELRSKKYDIIIHNAAVSDFVPLRSYSGKISSKSIFNLELKPLPKIIRYIRKLAPRAKLVLFKLEPRAADSVLIKRANSARRESKSDFVVANRFKPSYKAFIIDSAGNITIAGGKAEMCKKLLKIAGGIS